jgi:hypothetical protein
METFMCEVIRCSHPIIRTLCATLVQGARCLGLVVGVTWAISLTAAKGVSQAPDSTEYAVYSVVLDSLYNEVMTERYTVRDTTRGQFTIRQTDHVQWTLSSMPSVSAELVNAYVAANSQSAVLSPSGFITRLPVVIANGTDNEFAVFSRVGFNPDRTEAVLHTTYRSGNRCIMGEVVRLMKVNGVWIIQEAKQTITG